MSSTAEQSTMPDDAQEPLGATPGGLRVAVASVGAAILGAAPHVLHHVGLLAGAAIFAGVGGTLLFGAIGLVAAIPLLLKMRRRSRSWRVPAGALALFAGLFVVSSFVIAPALTGGMSDNDTSSPSSDPQSQDSLHEKHHPGSSGGEAGRASPPMPPPP